MLLSYVMQALRKPLLVRSEFQHPVQGSTPALLAVATLLIALAALPYSRPLSYALTMTGICWHLLFFLWHTGILWQGGRDALDTVPMLYLPTVAGNFTSAAALGALGHADWGWLFLGAGVFSWLALESLVIQRLWHTTGMPAQQRPLLGIQFAPPVVCAMAWQILTPGSTDHWLHSLFLPRIGLIPSAWPRQRWSD